MTDLCLWCRAPKHSGNCDREALKETIRILRLEAAASKKIEGRDVIWVQSLISHRTQKPRIDIQLGELHTQMDADSAMDLATNIIEVAEGAYADAFIFNFLMEKIGVDQERAAMVIPEFRDYRAKLAEEFRQLQKEKSSD